MTGQRGDHRARIRQRIEEGLVVVELSGELDLLEAPRVREAFSRLATRDRTHLVVDATGLGFIDVSGVRALAESRDQIHQRGSQFFVVPSPIVRRVLELLPLGFVLFSSVREAAEEIRRIRDQN